MFLRDREQSMPRDLISSRALSLVNHGAIYANFTSVKADVVTNQLALSPCAIIEAKRDTGVTLFPNERLLSSEVEEWTRSRRI